MDYDMTIHHNPDAQAWAKFFIDTTKDMDRDVFRDESYMVVWFSNAMMAMHDHLYVTEIVRRQNEAANEIERLREALAFYAEWGIDAPAVDAIIEEDCGDKARAALNIVLGEKE